MTLADVVSYDEKHNEANKEDNRDGHSENLSHNWGVEGPTDNPDINAYRQRLQRSMLATLFGSMGTPMLLGGDEFGRSQGGNNNAYCHDDELSWFDWNQADSEDGQALTAFVGRLAEIRRDIPPIRSGRFLYGEPVREGVLDIEWWDERGMQLSEDDWRNAEGRALVMRRSQIDEDGRLRSVSLLLNSSHEDLDFRLPEQNLAHMVRIDSADADVRDLDLEADVYRVMSGAAVIITSLERQA